MRLNINKMTLNLELGLTEETHDYIKRLFNRVQCVDVLNVVGDVLDVADVIEEIKAIAADRGSVLRNINIVASCH